MLAGGAFSAYRTPSSAARSAIQPAAAGTVFAGLTADVLQQLITDARIDASSVVFAAVGFAVGLLVTISVVQGLGEEGGALGPVIVVDLLVDGGLIGLSTSLGEPTAAVLAGALAPEVFFLGVTLAEQMKEDDPGRQGVAPKQRPRLMGRSELVAGGMLAGGALGWLIGQGPLDVRVAFFAFGAIALAYLVLEELLTEAHEQQRSPMHAAALFTAFSAVFVVGLLVQ